MAQAGQVFVNFGANTQGLLAGTARAGNILQRFSKTGVGAAIVMGASFVTLSRIMTSFATSAVSGFKDFEFHIVRAKALAGATAEEFIKMTDTAQELGRTTEFMAKDVAAGMSNLALAGFNANEIIKMIPDSLRLATAGGVALAKTNTIMANAIRGFSLDASQANQVANVMTATFTTTNTTLESLAQTFKNSVGVLATLGVQMEEVAAAAGVLGDVGINASVAGTGLKNFGIKLAKTFGMMKDGAKTAREFFESLGVTKEKLFDAETGTLNMVEAVRSFKTAMDKLGAARAPEFLAQFAKLFGARAAASLTALVRQAEAFQIQAQNTRMTEMIGDVQKVFENMDAAAGKTLYMTNLQEGLHDAVLGMVKSLAKGNTIMEEFTEHGLGAREAIERMSRDFEQTSKVMEDTFGTGEKGIFKVTDGLLEITKFTKNNAKEMVKYGEVLDELAKKNIGVKRRKQLEGEAAALKGVIEGDKRSVKELTSLGRARLLGLAAQVKSIRAMDADGKGKSKAVVQLEALNRLYKGNEKNIVTAANAMGIQVGKSDKLYGVLGKVKKALLGTAASADTQRYAMQRLVSQTAMTNTALDMQRIQLETLDGTFKLFKSGIELVSNKIAKALAPALDSTIKSATVFLRAMTLNNEEMARGVTATEKLNDAMNETFKIFKKNGGVFKEMKNGFDGLSSIGKTLAVTIGGLGAAGLAAGGAFIWVQALLPAFMALAGTFFTMVVPVIAVVTVLTLLGIKLKRTHDAVKEMGDAAKDSGDAMVGIYNNLKSKIDAVTASYDRFVERLENILGLTNRLNIVGGKFTLFNDKDLSKVVNLQDTVQSLDKAFEGLKGSSKVAGDKLKEAFKVGNAPEVNRLLMENTELAKAMGVAQLKAGFATSAQTDSYRQTNSLLTDALKNQKAMEESLNKQQVLFDKGRISQGRLNEAKKNSVDADMEVNELTKKRDKLYSKIIGHRGKLGKLTDKEKIDLLNIKGNIDEQQKSVLKVQAAMEKQAKLYKDGAKNTAELTKATKEYKKEHALLVDNQKRYNDILNKSMSRNPFVLMARHIKNIVSGDNFQKFLNDIAIQLSRLMDISLKFISIVGPPFMKFIKSVGKALVQLWPSINKLLGAVLSLFDAVFTAIGLILVDVFGFAEAKGGSVVDKLAAGIEGVARLIEKVAAKIKEMPLDKIKQFIVTFGAIAATLIGLKVAFGIFDGIFGRLKKLTGAAASLNSAFAPLFTALGVEGGLAGAFTAAAGLVGGVAPLLLIVFGIITAIGVLVTSMVIAFKDNLGGFRDAFMSFIALVITKVTEVAGRLFEMFSSFIDMIKSIATFIAPIIGAIMTQVLGFLGVIFKFAMTIIARVAQVLSGVFKVVSGVFSGDIAKIGEGFIDILEGIAQLVIGLIEAVVGFIVRQFTSLVALGISQVQTVLEYIINGLAKIPFLKDKLKGVPELLRATFNEAQGIVEAIPKAIAKAGDAASKSVSDLAEGGKAAIAGETVAEREVRLQKEKNEKAKKAADKKAEKQKATGVQTQGIEKALNTANLLAERTANNTDEGKQRPNVTTNTIVEYKAAEDDEVNRRMIERIMNDVLKAGVGMEMGDASGID